MSSKIIFTEFNFANGLQLDRKLTLIRLVLVQVCMYVRRVCETLMGGYYREVISNHKLTSLTQMCGCCYIFH